MEHDGDRTFILGLVVERERLCAALYTQDSTRVTGVGLIASDGSCEDLRDITYDVDLVLGEDAH